MVKPLSFKGDKKSNKKRKRPADDANDTKTLTTTNEEETQDEESWVTAELTSDITGPIILVLPTTLPSALACDASGKVFSLAIENMIEKNAATAEPHDVRQVWIANSVAGTEKFTFKGHHGKYLGCDKYGILNATKEAVSAEESFACVAEDETPGFFAIQNEHDKYIAVDAAQTVADKVARGDAENIDKTTRICVRMQARFKPKLKVAKEEKMRERVSRKELEDMVGRRLDEDDVKMLKKARRQGNFHERLLDVKVKGKHDKFA